MKALAYHSQDKRGWEERSKSSIKNPTGIVIREINTTICGIYPRNLIGK